MSLSIEEQIEIIMDNAQEVVSDSALQKLLEEKEERLAYVGFEPSGKVHIGWLILAKKIQDLVECNFTVTILLADWHAYINDKFDGNIEAIKACGKYMEHCFSALGADPEKVRFIYASELIDGAKYWERVLRSAKKCSLSRIKRSMTIMGRKGDEGETDTSKFFYPAMQVADIFELDVDLALGGMDQRKAHMLALDVAEKNKWKKPVALHTPLISGLKAGGRMDPVERKMSKSDPDTSIFIHDDLPDIKRKLKKAYCPQGEIDGNPVVEIAKFITFPRGVELEIKRPEKWGGNFTIPSYGELDEMFMSGELHPLDLKMAVADALDQILKPIREKLVETYGSLDAVKNMQFLK